jgi:hypothetical protein
VDASGGVGFDAWWLEADNPGPVIVCNVARLTTAGYAGYPSWSGSQAGADADVNNFNADLLAVVAEFGSMVQIADLDTALAKGVPPAGAPAGVTTTICPDGVHPNEYGAARCADAVIAAVRTLYPEGPLGDAAYLNTDAPLAAGMRLPRQSGQWCIPEIGAWDATAYTAVAGHMFAIPVVVTEGRERWIGLQVEQINAPATSGSSIRWAVYDDVLWSGYPCCLITELTGGGALALGTTTGMKQSPASGGGSLNQPLDPGLYWLVAKIDALGTTASQLRAINGPSPYLPAAAWVAGTPGKAMAWQLTGQSAGVLPGTFPAGAPDPARASGSRSTSGFPGGAMPGYPANQTANVRPR